ncbi:MAG TPA: hypothetical protein VLW26_01270 [Steroidobacteraceae bacterium]|nr:hypothetical protein [Steroidobacteraceae bacterium]
MRSLAPSCVALLALSGCGAVNVKPAPALPHALIVPLPARVVLVIPKDVRKFTDRETRDGVDWRIELGPAHEQLLRDLFRDEFSDVVVMEDLAAARQVTDAKAIFEVHIDQFSFATSRQTGRYTAATIRYRIQLYTPAGETFDTFTLTGYGNSQSEGMSASKPLEVACNAAMRDAAAKFLVQLPELPVGKRLAQNQPVSVEKVAEDAGQIELVPIDEP